VTDDSKEVALVRVEGSHVVDLSAMLQGAEWRDLVATNMYTSDGRKVDKQILDTYFHKDQWVNSSKPVRREPGNLACAPGRFHKYLFWRLVVPKAADEDATAGDGDDDAEEQTAAAAKAAASKAKRVAELVKAGHAQLQLDVAHVRYDGVRLAMQ